MCFLLYIESFFKLLTHDERQDLSSDKSSIVIGRSLLIVCAEVGGVKDVNEDVVQHVTMTKTGGIDHPGGATHGVVESPVAELIRSAGWEVNAIQIKAYKCCC